MFVDRKRSVRGMAVIATILVLSLLAGKTKAQTTWHVPTDFPTIQSAIEGSSNGDEIVVAPGTYNEAINFLGKAIHLRSSDGPEVTILDGKGLNDSVVKTVNGEGRETVLRGFTITGGVGQLVPSTGLRLGGGMFNSGTSPTIVDCVFQSNSVVGNGGGMYNGSASPLIIDCQFIGNVASTTPQPSTPSIRGCGGGMYNSQSSPVIMHTSFVDNSAYITGLPTSNVTVGSGGGLFNIASTVSIQHCMFQENTSVSYCGPDCGGGGISNLFSHLLIEHTNFLGNTASGWMDYYGGGIHALYSGTIMLTACTFQSNTASSGGAIFKDLGTGITVQECMFIDNNPGIALYHAFGESVFSDCYFEGNTVALRAFASGDVSVNHCEFVQNASPIWAWSTNLSITDSAFIQNSSWRGGAVVVEAGHLSVIESEFVGNTAAESGGAIWNWGLTGLPSLVEDSSFVDNSASVTGGAIHFRSSASLIGNSFSGNAAPEGSGVFMFGWSSAKFETRDGIGDGVATGARLFIGGSNPGTTVVEGSYRQWVVYPDEQWPEFSGPGELAIRLGGLISEVEHDLLEVTGTAELAGLLDVSLINGFVPAAGDSFHVLTAASIEGVFDVAILPPMPPGLVMTVNYQTGNSGGAAGINGDAAVVLNVQELAQLLGFGNPEMIGIPGLPTAVATGDFNNSGDLDIAITFQGASPADPGSVLVLYNTGGGDSFGGQQFPVGPQPSGIAVGDFNSNGRLDIAVSNAGSNDVTILHNTGNAGNGAGFENAGSVTVGSVPSAIVAGDFRNIDVIDLAVANAGDNSIHVLNNDGSGQFELASALSTDQQPVALAIDDFNHDGWIDIAVANYEGMQVEGQMIGTVQVYQNTGSGSFAAQPSIPVGQGPIKISVEDVDNNKDPDIIVVNAISQSMTIIRNGGGGTFTAPIGVPMSGEPLDMVAFDMDQDGDIDFAIIIQPEEGQSYVQILRNDTPAPGQIVLSHADVLAEGDGVILLASGDIGGDGAEDLITIAGPSSEAEGGGAAGSPESSLMIWPNLLGKQPTQPCPADLTGSGSVGVFDLFELLGQWGVCIECHNCSADLTGNCSVGIFDLLELLGAWGPCP